MDSGIRNSAGRSSEVAAKRAIQKVVRPDGRRKAENKRANDRDRARETVREERKKSDERERKLETRGRGKMKKDERVRIGKAPGKKRERMKRSD